MWKKLTQVYVVDRIEPCVAFWTERFGFETSISVPEGDHLGYVALQREGVELQYRTRSSLVADIPQLSKFPPNDSSVITIELSSVDQVLNKLAGVEVLIPRRRTFYGHNEVVIRAPGGQIVVFTAPGEEQTIMIASPFANTAQPGAT
jgi:hypothetical protein